MKTKYQMIKAALKSGITKKQIRNKYYYGHVFNLNFSDWDFQSANFQSANFQYANFQSADFQSADFQSANFRSADFRYADFRYADFRSADFQSANFRSADFRSANFQSADFRSANLNFIINECTTFLTLACPEEGEFIGFKKCQNDTIVKLLILNDSKRSSATTLKCRCSKAKVLEISNGLTEIESNHDSEFIYKIGEIVEVLDFDECRWNECSTGIHFFMSRKLAEQY